MLKALRNVQGNISSRRYFVFVHTPQKSDLDFKSVFLEIMLQMMKSDLSGEVSLSMMLRDALIHL